MKKRNAAARVHATLSRAASLQATDALMGWTGTFRLDGPDYDRERVVARLLSGLQEQLDQVRQGMRDIDWETEVYAGTLNRVERAISLRNLGASWAQVQLPADVLLQLSMIAQGLPNDDSDLSAEELIELKLEVIELKEHVTASDLPAHLISFLVRQLKIIEDGLLEYPIRGNSAFRDASVQAAADWDEAPSEIFEHLDREEVRKTAAWWPALQKRGRQYLFIRKLAWAVLADTAGLVAGGHAMKLLSPTSCAAVSQPVSDTRFATASDAESAALVDQQARE